MWLYYIFCLYKLKKKINLYLWYTASIFISNMSKSDSNKYQSQNDPAMIGYEQ